MAITLSEDERGIPMIGLETLLTGAIGAAMGVLAKAGFEDEAVSLKERLTKRTEKARQAAFTQAFDQAAKVISEENLKPFLNHRPFREEVVKGLLDPMQGFDLKAVGKNGPGVWTLTPWDCAGSLTPLKSPCWRMIYGGQF